MAHLFHTAIRSTEHTFRARRSTFYKVKLSAKTGIFRSPPSAVQKATGARFGDIQPGHEAL